ncbi:unnamed protein product [Vitrella brassicaformis CCMP3155]|uniref:Peptidase S54 rhomboid domain-containing protein n=2 Tax=Vitrella brassicaformis TaxID=1169539 RepID=A0A0G4EB91_VITBC|nr:unnamed protein product [Vitrella brassicaformis CCMP3155]|mmetsp:Transcript_1220/g.3159  ORF Transcript_1220/g.3159 Transcript_1220/m.3159 type:complete len:325 (+) Transcript_1220:67-1041(+)|eukprot:CEL92534.1 unnamed protein product [Vitrella brassicaformis CCMP3155]
MDGNVFLDNISDGMERAFAYHSSFRNPALTGSLLANTAVFVAWRLGARRRMPHIINSLSRHFICSPEALKNGRYHTLVTCGFSHITLPHFLVNAWALDLFGRSVASDLSTRDFLALYGLSSAAAALVQVRTSGMPVAGASGMVMALSMVVACLRPRESYIVIFPLPALSLTALQLSDLSVGINLLMHYYTRWRLGGGGYRVGGRGGMQAFVTIAWAGHLAGCMSGLGFVYWKRLVEGSNKYFDWINLHQQFFWYDWRVSFLNFGSSCRQFLLRCQLRQETLSKAERRLLEGELDRLKTEQALRRRLQGADGGVPRTMGGGGWFG